MFFRKQSLHAFKTLSRHLPGRTEKYYKYYNTTKELSDYQHLGRDLTPELPNHNVLPPLTFLIWFQKYRYNQHCCSASFNSGCADLLVHWRITRGLQWWVGGRKSQVWKQKSEWRRVTNGLYSRTVSKKDTVLHSARHFIQELYAPQNC
jgi:hypothetical protein